MILPMVLAAVVSFATPRPVPPSVDAVFGFQELQLESPPPDPIDAVADEPPAQQNTVHAYVEDVQLGARRLRVYVNLYKGAVEAIELQPVDVGDMPDLYRDIVRMYGQPTGHKALETYWEGHKARLVWTKLFGTHIITLTSRKLEKEMHDGQQP